MCEGFEKNLAGQAEEAAQPLFLGALRRCSSPVPALVFSETGARREKAGKIFLKTLPVFLLLFSLPLFAEESAPQQAFQKGLELRNEGRYEEAESQFKRALEEEPSNADYHFELANLYAVEYDGALHEKENLRGRQFLESSARELEQALMIRQDFIPAEFNLGVVYKKLARYEDARCLFKQVLQSDPNSFQAMHQVAETYELQGFFDEAETVYEEARDRGMPPEEIQNALYELSQQRAASSRDHQSQLRQSLGMLQQGMNSGSYGQPQSGGTPGLGSLAPLLMQQFMKSRGGNQRSSQDAQW